MEYPLGVGGDEPGGDLLGQAHRTGRHERLKTVPAGVGDQAPELHPPDQLEQEIQVPGLQRAGGVATRDVGMAHLLEHDRLVDETFARLGVAHPPVVQQLQSATQAPHHRLDLVYRPEATGPEAAQDPVLAADDSRTEERIPEPPELGPSGRTVGTVRRVAGGERGLAIGAVRGHGTPEPWEEGWTG